MSHNSSPPSIVEHLYRALEAPIGIVVRSNNPELLRMKLYAARRDAMNPEFEALTIALSRSNPTTELWICKKAPTNGQA